MSNIGLLNVELKNLEKGWDYLPIRKVDVGEIVPPDLLDLARPLE
jgi:hypothetical protein